MPNNLKTSHQNRQNKSPKSAKFDSTDELYYSLRYKKMINLTLIFIILGLVGIAIFNIQLILKNLN